MAKYVAQFKTDDSTFVIAKSDSRHQAQMAADDWNKRHGTTDKRLDDHAVVVRT